MRRSVAWLTLLAFITCSMFTPGMAVATEQYDDESDEPEISVDDFDTSDDGESSASEEQYDDEDMEETTSIESTVPEVDIPESTGIDDEDDEANDETTSTEDEDPDETTIPEEDTDDGDTGDTGDTGDGGDNGSDGDDPSEGDLPGWSGTGVPPISQTEPPDIGDEFTVTIIDHTVDLTVVNIYDGTIICSLPGGDTIEVLLYDLDYDGWISYYETYICLAGWLGYRYYDYTPDDVYHYIGDVYNIDISNNYQQTGAIRPTPTERVSQILPATGGPAIVVGAVLLAIGGAALIGRYSRRS